jgi:RNA polymerase sigma factor (TIGR02999 family)
MTDRPIDEQVSQVLAAWAQQDRSARERLMPLVYDELRRLAHGYMRRERDGHTLQTTALVNEVYLRLAGLERMQWRDRAHFMAMAATLMRRILVDYARERQADKRGAGVSITSIEDHDPAGPQREMNLIALDEALARLAAFDAQQSRIVEMRFFGGLTVEETAEALDISPTTVKREWASARAWLHHQLASR